jgi:hypothetical protein
MSSGDFSIATARNYQLVSTFVCGWAISQHLVDACDKCCSRQRFEDDAFVANATKTEVFGVARAIVIHEGSDQSKDLYLVLKLAELVACFYVPQRVLQRMLSLLAAWRHTSSM